MQLENLVRLDHVGYQHLEQFQTKQCIEVLTTGALSQISCNLPPHCGRIEYYKNSSAWFKEVGLCIGLGSNPIIFNISGIAYSKNLMKVHVPKTNIVKLRHKFTNKSNKITVLGHITRVMTMEDVVMVLLEQEKTGNWYIYSAALEWSFPMYDRSFISKRPLTRTVDSKICIPTISGNRIPIILGPMNKTQALSNCMFTPAWLPGMKPTTLQFITDYDNYMNGAGLIVTNDNDFTLDCDPAKSTMTLLPITITSILNTIGQAVMVLLVTISSMLMEAIYQLIRILNQSINMYITSLLIIYNKYRYKMTIFDATITSIVLTLVVQLIYRHYNHGYN